MGEGNEKDFDDDLGFEPNHMNVDSISSKKRKKRMWTLLWSNTTLF